MNEKTAMMRTRSHFHPFNDEDTVFQSYPENPLRTNLNMNMNNEATVIEEKGTMAKLRLVGTAPCYDQLKLDTWIHQITTMEIVDSIHSGIQMWKLVCVFKNLKNVKINIIGQNCPIDQKISIPVPIPDELEPNGSITHLTIVSNYKFDARNPDYNDGVVSLLILSLKMASKCTNLASFHIEIPDDNGNYLVRAVKDFVMRSKFESNIVLKMIQHEWKILCIQPPVGVGNNNAVRPPPTPPQQLLPPEQRRTLLALAPPAGAGAGPRPGVPQNTPAHHFPAWNPPSVPNMSSPKRRKP